MLEESNRQLFDHWTSQLVNKRLQNMQMVRDYEWRNSLAASNFDLLKRLQQCLNLSE